MKKVVFGILTITVLGIFLMFFGRWELFLYSGGVSSGHGGGYYWSKGACMTTGALAVQESPGSVTVGNWEAVSRIDSFTCGIGCHRVGLDGHLCLIED